MGYVKLPIGPQHPALKEPENFTITLDGERVVNVDIRIGYIHRGIEKLMETRTYTQNLYLVERICGICSYAHVYNFTQNVEEILGLQIPKRAEYIRTLFLELERLHSHFLWLGVAGHEIGFDTLFMYTWQDREVVQDLLEMISGNRVNYAMNAIGGVRRDVSQEHRKKVLESMDYLEKRAEFYKNVAINEKTILARAENVGILKPQVALRLTAVGPTARASGISVDIRKDDPYASYLDTPFEVITTDTNDVLGRVVVRVLEIVESIKIIRYLMEHLPEGDILKKAPRKIPEGESISHTEAPRGEDIHYLHSNGTEKPDRYKVRTPTLANLPATAEMLKETYLADVPIIVAAIDPCMGCMDRVLLLKDGQEKPGELISGEQLRRYGIKWYAERGWNA
ncbi:MAG: nickel-dependent hydrogenase large subunit [Candidatus Thermoplasmatota archaeon]|jgi:NADH-quinone oxidoreductase subunit D|nr:nickel-dependent hydrogenase large subunit [Candidatus Thermoplasmatota archaeon]